MPRVKMITNLPLQEDLEREMKERFGAYLSKNELRQYLRIGRGREDVFGMFPTYQLTPTRRVYRAREVAAVLAARRSAGAEG